MVFLGCLILGVLLVPIIIFATMPFWGDGECPMFLRQKEKDERDDW